MQKLTTFLLTFLFLLCIQRITPTEPSLQITPEIPLKKNAIGFEVSALIKGLRLKSRRIIG